jgi:hypothetical protein
MNAKTLLNDRRETHEEIAEALSSCAAPSAGGVAYLRELSEKARRQGEQVKALAAERGGRFGDQSH